MSTRRSQRRDPETTRRDLVAHAVAHFAEAGYEGTSLDAVVAAAGVTKGALYHHFAGKRELFAAAFEVVEQKLIDETRAAASTASGEERTLTGLRLFLENVRDPAFRQIALIDGPSVLGWTAQDPSSRPGFPSLVRTFQRILEPDWDLSVTSMEMMARMLFALCVTAASAVAEGDSPEETERTRLEAEAAVLLVLASLRDASRRHPDARTAIAVPFAT